MELFLDNTPKSKFLSFLADLTNLSKKTINPIALSESALKMLSEPEAKFKLPSLPCLITSEGNVLTSIFSISSYFTQISYTEKILFDRPQEIVSVIEFLERKPMQDIIKYFNEMLETKSFLVGQHLTLADLALFSYVQKTLVMMINNYNLTDQVLYTDEMKWEVCNLYRWFLHIQAMPNIKEYLLRNSMQLALKPKPIIIQEKSKAQQKKEQKKQQKNEKKEENKQQPQQQQKAKAQQPQQKQQQQQQQKKTGNVRPKIPGEVKAEDFYIFDMRIGKLSEVWRHESSNKLYCEKISTGSKQYNVASGLQHHIPMDQMKGQIILLTNLKERKLAGFLSEGMVMCASVKDEKEERIELLRVEAQDQGENEIGGRVLLEGVKESEGFVDVTDKDGVVGKLLKEMKVDAEGFATFLGRKWIVNGKFVKAATLRDCMIS